MDVHHSPAAVSTAVLTEIAKAAVAHDRDASFPHDSLAALQRAGLLGLTVPARLGGGAAGLGRAGDAVAAVGGACASTALVFAMQLLHQRRVADSGEFAPSVSDRVGRAAVERGELINALRVEPALGTPARGGLPETVARRTADGFCISGRKIYSTGAPGLARLLVWARTDDATPLVGSFLVPARAPGVRIEESWDHLGLRASGSHDVVLEDVSIPADHAGRLAPVAEWARADPTTAAWNVVLIGAVYTGVARAARDWIVRFLHERRPANLGASLATLPRMQEAVGAIEERLAVNAALLDAAAQAVDLGTPHPPLTLNLFKTTLAENAVRAVEQAVALAGNHALSRQNPLERHLRDVLCARIHTPQIDTAHIAAGRAALGL
jgi:alkylation response protein AidB-like acyl-CoA dehydrogenase